MSVSHHLTPFGCAENQADCTPFPLVAEGSPGLGGFHVVPSTGGKQRRSPAGIRAEMTAAVGADRKAKVES